MFVLVIMRVLSERAATALARYRKPVRRRAIAAMECGLQRLILLPMAVLPKMDKGC
jgi:hypothetical protein